MIINIQEILKELESNKPTKRSLILNNPEKEFRTFVEKCTKENIDNLGNLTDSGIFKLASQLQFIIDDGLTAPPDPSFNNLLNGLTRLIGYDVLTIIRNLKANNMASVEEFLPVLHHVEMIRETSVALQKKARDFGHIIGTYLQVELKRLENELAELRRPLSIKEEEFTNWLCHLPYGLDAEYTNDAYLKCHQTRLEMNELRASYNTNSAPIKLQIKAVKDDRVTFNPLHGLSIKKCWRHTRYTTEYKNFIAMIDGITAIFEKINTRDCSSEIAGLQNTRKTLADLIATRIQYTPKPQNNELAKTTNTIPVLTVNKTADVTLSRKNMFTATKNPDTQDIELMTLRKP